MWGVFRSLYLHDYFKLGLFPQYVLCEPCDSLQVLQNRLGKTPGLKAILANKSKGGDINVCEYALFIFCPPLFYFLNANSKEPPFP